MWVATCLPATAPTSEPRPPLPPAAASTLDAIPLSPLLPSLPPPRPLPSLAQPNGYIFTSLINACEKGGQWERAVQLFKLMQSQDINAASMTMVARKAM